MMRFNRSKRRITTAAVVTMMALGAAPVSAQMMGGGGMGGGGTGGGKGHRGSQQGQKTDAKPKPNEKAYNSALSGIPDRKFDPWKSVR